MREFGIKKIKVDQKSPLFEGVSEETMVLMSHGDKCIELPPGFKWIAWNEEGEGVAFEYGITE